MFAAILLVGLAQVPNIARDAYGVPHIQAANAGDAFFQAGYAVAQDRLWQMETSRRLARGQLAEVLGASFAASDREVLQTGYTDDELQAQVDRLSLRSREILARYADGVNAYIVQAKASLPPEYAKYGFEPRPWTVLDSAAIAVRLFQQFGRGGAGEIRDMAILGYLQARPNLKGHVLDVLDDFAWFNDPSSPTTLQPEDDPQASHPPVIFPKPDRATTERHIAMLPKLSLLDLLPGLELSNRATSTQMAERLNAPFMTGSYCMVVGANRSGTGHPLLLNGPQMGFRTPSIVHEMSISTPEFSVVGMDVPGVPGVVVGHTGAMAWGLTSGVADTDDVFFYKPSGPDGYLYGGQARPLQSIKRVLRVKNQSDQTVEELRTGDGPVVIRKAGVAILAKKTSYWNAELQSYDALTALWSDRDASSIERTMDGATMSFNFFYATRAGDVGWKYVGRVPLRAPGVDPRFPTPGDPKFAWRGFLPPAQMPHVRNPKRGLIVNWNTKPVAWWPNGDTPVWGAIFRSQEVANALSKPKLNAQDLELAAWTIARRDETWPFFRPFVERSPAAGEPIRGFDGWLLQGSRQAAAYETFLGDLRRELFEPVTGNFISPDYFRLVAQPSVMLRALQRRTRFDYLGGRDPRKIVSAALAAGQGSEAYQAPSIPVPDEAAIPYSDRGTYIQVIEILAGRIDGRDVVTPGEAESGPHSHDQVPLARAWIYKPMVPKP